MQPSCESGVLTIEIENFSRRPGERGRYVSGEGVEQMQQKWPIVVMVATLILVGKVTSHASEQRSLLPPGEWNLVFHDDFTGSEEALDHTWEFENGSSGHILCSRWRDNAVVSNGVLKLNARKEKRGGQEWTAASMWTKRKFKYGYFECCYKYAKAKGTNNSFWLMTRDIPKDAPGRFEIDINEGHYPDRINMNIHNWSGEHWSKSKHTTVNGANLADEFHTYGLEWNKDQLIWYFDGKQIRRENNTICHGESHVWLSLAIIKWAGPVTDAIDGTAMDVDYVRVYQRDESGHNKPDAGDSK